MSISSPSSVRERFYFILLFMTLLLLLWADNSQGKSTYLKIGIMEEPKTLNRFQASDVWSNNVLMSIYQHLYIRRPETYSMVPWLAADDPVYDQKAKTVTFHLRKMQWDDGTDFTAEDVVFTAKVFKRFSIPRYSYRWKFVDKIEALDPRTVRLILKKPSAILWERTLSTWVVQKKKWEPVIKQAEQKLESALAKLKEKGKTGRKAMKEALKEPLKLILTHQVNRPVGLGPFKFAVWKRGSFIQLVRNERFFGSGKEISGYPLGPYIDGIIFKIYGTTDAATLALKKGDIDFFWYGIPPGYMKDMADDPNINVYRSMKSGFRYMGFNLRKPPMSDKAFRQAIAYVIDKKFLVERILHNYGQIMDSVVPPVNRFYFNGNTFTYGRGKNRNERVKKAYQILRDAGYNWKKPPVDASGKLQRGRGMIMPNGKPVPELEILTPPADYDPTRAMAGMLSQEWIRQLGVPLIWKPMAFSALLQKIKKERDFDIFIMGWGNLSMDPDYMRTFFHSRSDRVNGRNYMGYRNKVYDELADEQAETMDKEARKKIIFRLQEMIVEDAPYIPLFVPFNLEGVRSDRFTGWVRVVSTIGNSWSLCMIRPTNQ